MSKRLQVVLGDGDLERYSRTAEAAGLSLSEWARQALRLAEREVSGGNVERRLAVIRRAVSHGSNDPEVDIETMLEETEAGYTADSVAGSEPGQL